MTQQKKEQVLSGIEDKIVTITRASSGVASPTALLLGSWGAKVVPGAR